MGESTNQLPIDIAELQARLTAALVLLAAVLLFAALADAPLEAQANPGMSPNPAKAPWYFLGLQEMVRQLAHPSRQGIEVARYAVSLLQLERKLAADPKRLEAIGNGLQVAASHRTNFRRPNLGSNRSSDIDDPPR